MSPAHRVPAQDEKPPSAQIAVEALQRALASEHAAVWAYSLALAFVEPDVRARVESDLGAHKKLRQDVSAALTELAERPVSAQPAYSPPQPVADAESAYQLLATAETDTIAGWRSLVERAPNPDMRSAGLTRMTDSTIRCAFWRGVTDQTPRVPVFPGRV
ncbi:ferritin-like domain-containing protein [Pseudonocardia nantongensis]|uniref:ferritin-like domain-containing protein n=1 Tax=Pseudonocardia nantongensis TaxID=1181885 RepID=UPI00397A222D